MTTSSAHWIDCIRAFLHDPPDKALDIKGHELRAARYQNAAFDVPGEPVRAGAVKPADWLASAIERLPLPKGTLRDCDNIPLDPILEQPFNRIPRDQLCRTSPIDGSDLSNDTMSHRQAQDLSAITVDKREAVIRALAQANPDHRLRALALWRLMPDCLPHVSALPGDTRLTDHSIIDHADAAMAACAALRSTRDERTEVRAPIEGDATERGLQSASRVPPQSASMLTFSLGPVQSFIVQGRSLRDLWTGSYLLSWLTFHAMTPILDELGPWCVTSPGLRGNPMCDWWLGQQHVRDEHGTCIAASDGLRCAGIPNTFTALVPTAIAAELQQRVKDACDTAWKQICNAVHTQLQDCWGTDWDTGWDDQCAEVWDMRCVTLPVLTVTSSGSVSEATAALRELYQQLIGELPQSVVDASTIAEALAEAKLSPGYVKKSGQGLWPLANDLTQRLMQADKRARHVPAHAPTSDTREKCALFAGCAVMGPMGATRDNKEWWAKHATRVPSRLTGRLRGNERLSAPGLVKRFAYGVYFRDVVRVGFQDTREVAFGDWVARLRATTHGVLQWNNWQKTVAGINRRSDNAIDHDWADHDLLDEGSLVAAHWVHADADEATQRKELDKARTERAKLVAKAHDAGLPDPRPYYAVLVADGDNMGKILRGERGPRFDQAYHPLMLAKLREIGLSPQVLSGVRPQGMASQLAFSRHLGEFTRQASDTIAKHRGTCVYAGGDDVLAVLPVANALTAAADLATNFSTWVPGATLSEDWPSSIAKRTCAWRSSRRAPPNNSPSSQEKIASAVPSCAAVGTTPWR